MSWDTIEYNCLLSRFGNLASINDWRTTQRLHKIHLGEIHLEICLICPKQTIKCHKQRYWQENYTYAKFNKFGLVFSMF